MLVGVRGASKPASARLVAARPRWPPGLCCWLNRVGANRASLAIFDTVRYRRWSVSSTAAAAGYLIPATIMTSASAKPQPMRLHSMIRCASFETSGRLFMAPDLDRGI
jgi:hypothetical protein